MIKDLIESLKGNTDITDIVSTRIYNREPIRTPEGTYLEVYRTNKTRQVASESNILQIFVFGKLVGEMEALSDLIIEHLEDKLVLNTNPYFKCNLVNQADNNIKLDNGFYFNIITFQFQKVT